MLSDLHWLSQKRQARRDSACLCLTQVKHSTKRKVCKVAAKGWVCWGGLGNSERIFD